MLLMVSLAAACCLGAPAEEKFPLLVAHRGASYDAPENTLAAFRLAWEQEADAIEGDFYLTKDGRIACIHDATTKRTAGADLRVAETTLEELRKLDVGSWKGPEWAGERIPTLEEVLATVPERGRIFIEVKCGPEIAEPLRDTLSRSRLRPDQTVVIAFDADVIAAVKRTIPRIAAHWLTGYKKEKETGRWTPQPGEVLTTLAACKADGLDTNANAEVVGADLVRALRDRGLQFHVWTVDDPVDAARWQMLGADSITTDRPAFIRESLLSPGLPQALRLWLPLDGDLRDASGRGRGGEPRGGSAQKMRFVEAVFGKGLDLGESGAAIALRCRLAERGTISLWYRPAPWYDHQTIVDSSAGENAWEMWIYRTGQLRFRIHPEGRGVSHSFHPTGDACEWHHIAVTWEKIGAAAAKLQLFANGHLADSTGEGSDRWLDPPEELFLGGGHPRNTPGRGIWDDVAVFDRPLRPAEIRFVMTAGAGALGARPQTGPR